MRPSSMIFILVLSSASLNAQTSNGNSSAVFVSPRAAQACPVQLFVDRLAGYGRIETGTPRLTDKDRKLLEDQLRSMTALSEQIVALNAQRAALLAKRSQQTAGADPAAVQQLTEQIQALETQIATKTRELQTINSLYQKLEQAVATLNQSSESPGQGLNLTFAAPARILSADITVRFYPAAARAIPATPSVTNGAPVTETFHLSGNTGEPIWRTSVWTKHTAIVSWVDLTHLEFSDGTSWQSTAPRQCGAAPNLYVLVDSASSR